MWPRCGEAELDAGEEELVPLVELALLGHPGSDIGLGEPAPPGDEMRDKLADRCGEAVRVEPGGRDGVGRHGDIVEADRAELGGQRSR